MSEINKQDMFFGAALSHLLNKNVDSSTSLLENADEARQARMYKMITNTSEDFRIYMKYRSQGAKLRCVDSTSWQFTFNDADKMRIEECIASGEKTYIVLICGSENLVGGEIVVLTQNEYLAVAHKQSITIKIRKRCRQIEVAEKSGVGLKIDRNRSNKKLTEILDCRNLEKHMKSIGKAA